MRTNTVFFFLEIILFALWIHLRWVHYQEYLNIQNLNNVISCKIRYQRWDKSDWKNLFEHAWNNNSSVVYWPLIPDIGLGVRVFNGPGELGSIPGRVIPKTQKMVLDASLLNTQHYKVQIKGKVEQSREGVVPSSTHWCSSYRKGSLRVTLDYGRQLYLLIFTSYPAGLSK